MNPSSPLATLNSRCIKNLPKFSANFSLSGSKRKLAELFGYYCYSNNSTNQQNGQEKSYLKNPSIVDILVLIPVAAQQVF